MQDLDDLLKHYNPDHACHVAVQRGRLDVLQCARARGYPWDESICHEAAANGHLHILQWAHQNGCPWDWYTCFEAAFNGHLDILQWARQNGCPWNATVCSWSARNGHFEVLKWARLNGCPWNSLACYYAALYDHIHIVQWCLKNGCILGGDTRLILQNRKFILYHINSQEWLHDQYGYFATSNLKAFIHVLNESITNVLWIPDLVNVIKCFI